MTKYTKFNVYSFEEILANFDPDKVTLNHPGIPEGI